MAFSQMGMEIINVNERSHTERKMLPGLCFEFFWCVGNIEGIFVCVDELNKR